MTSLLTRLYLSLFIFLSSLGQVSAHAATLSDSSQAADFHKIACPGTELTHIIGATPSHEAKHTIKIDAREAREEEEDEHELVSVKKNVRAAYTLSTILFNQLDAFAGFTHYGGRYFNFYSADRHILIRVLRI